MQKLRGIQTEVDAAYLYDVLAKHEEDPAIAGVYRQMSEIEKGHATVFARKSGLPIEELRPSARARTINLIGKVFGYDYVLGSLIDTEKSISNAMIEGKLRRNLEPSGREGTHVNILRSILEKQPAITPAQLSRFERRHRTIGGNAIRAAVLGGNDGLVSNFSLVMGVAAASPGTSTVLLAGIAGLLAGALSMALGEWISVRSSQELYENQMQVEMEELEMDPEGEMRELALIYLAKGIDEAEAYRIAKELMADKTQAHQVLIREELGINTAELKGSAMQAALYSFVLFAIGAIVPVIPFLFGIPSPVLVSVVLSASALFLIGAAITLYTGRGMLVSGLRQLLFGLAAAAVTFGIGKLIGIGLS